MDKKKNIKLIAISASIPFLIFLCLAVILYQQFLVMSEQQLSNKIENYTELTQIAPHNATIFFGDSITELCPLEDLYFEYSQNIGIPVINRGISAEKTDTMLERLESTVLQAEPRNLVMLMGINDYLSGVQKETILANIQAMITLTKQSSPSTKIILQSLYPMNFSMRTSLLEKFQGRGKQNEDIQEINEGLKKLAAKENIIFLDVYDDLIDEVGNLKEEYTYDGLHPNTKGYLAIRDKIIDSILP